MLDRTASESLDALCDVCDTHASVWQLADGRCSIEAIDAQRQSYLVEAESEISAVCLLAEQLGADLSDI